VRPVLIFTATQHHCPLLGGKGICVNDLPRVIMVKWYGGGLNLQPPEQQADNQNHTAITNITTYVIVEMCTKFMAGLNSCKGQWKVRTCLFLASQMNWIIQLHQILKPTFPKGFTNIFQIFSGPQWQSAQHLPAEKLQTSRINQSNCHCAVTLQKCKSEPIWHWKVS